MVNLFLFFLISIIIAKTNVNIFLFLEKTPVHQVILYNDKKKHVEGSLFDANQMLLLETKNNSKGANK